MPTFLSLKFYLTMFSSSMYLCILMVKTLSIFQPTSLKSFRKVLYATAIKFRKESLHSGAMPIYIYLIS